MTATMSVERAQKRLAQFERRMLDDATRVGVADAPTLVRRAVGLAAHAALPAACDAELLHLLRINFFVDTEALPYWVEGRLLLSPLWQELGDGLYLMEPTLRRLLMQRLFAHGGPRRVAEVATLLWQSAERRAGWAERTELRHAQQLTALNFLAPERARDWLAQARGSGSGETLAEDWFVAMGQELPALPQPTAQAGDPELWCRLLLDLVPLADSTPSDVTRPQQMVILPGQPGSALEWRLLAWLARRSTPPRLLRFEVEPGSGGQRLLATLPGRRDRTALTTDDVLWATGAIPVSGSVVAIDGAQGLGAQALQTWLLRFSGAELFLLGHWGTPPSRFGVAFTEIDLLDVEAKRAGREVEVAQSWPPFRPEVFLAWASRLGDVVAAARPDGPGDGLLDGDRLFETTGGQPERVYEALCAYAGVRWPDIVALARARFEPAAPVSAREALLALAAEYDATRARMTASGARTAAMEAIVSRMREQLAAEPQSDSFDAWATDGRAGVRLLGVCLLRDWPSAARCAWLGERGAVEKPFVAYHALVALREAARQLPLADMGRVQAALQRAAKGLEVVRPDADRRRVLEEALRIVRSRRAEASLEALVGGAPLLPGAEVTWHRGSPTAPAIAAGVGASVYVGSARQGAVGTVAEVLSRDGEAALQLLGRTRVRVLSVERAGRDLPQVQVAAYPDAPAPTEAGLFWSRVASAIDALCRIDAALRARVLDRRVRDAADVYACLAALRTASAPLQAMYAEQDPERKRELAFDLLLAAVRGHLHRAPSLDAKDLALLNAELDRALSAPAERRFLVSGRIDDPRPLADGPLLAGSPHPPVVARILVVLPGHDEVWRLLAPFLEPQPAPAQSALRLWPVGSMLKLRFIGGDNFRRERVLRMAAEWFEHANLELEVLPAKSKAAADIRIAFNDQDGSWSYVGTDVKEVPQYQPTMNLGWIGPTTSDDVARAAVLKEFGHALGLIQEHQNPNLRFKWNEAAVIADMSRPPNFWTEAQVRQNILTRYAPFEYRPFDPDSVMCFTIPAKWTQPPQAAGGATRLSASDKALIARLYPGKTAASPALPRSVRRAKAPRRKAPPARAA